MAISNASPNVDNYYVGKGKVYIKLEGEADYVDIGNVPEFEFTPTVDKLDHFSSREGTKTKDRSIVVQRSASLRMVMEEWTARNLALVLMGDVIESGNIVSIDIFANNVAVAAVRFVGENDVGPKWTLEFPRVEFAPSSSINPISEEWGTLEATGEVVESNGTFGTASCDFNG